jgi:hypothetical protein
MEADHIDDIKIILMDSISNIIAMIIMSGSSDICEATNPEDALEARSVTSARLVLCTSYR